MVEDSDFDSFGKSCGPPTIFILLFGTAGVDGTLAGNVL